MHDCDAYLNQHRDSCIEGKVDQQRDHLNELVGVGTLYFPELDKEITSFYLEGKHLFVEGIKLTRALGHAGEDRAARHSAYDSFLAEWDTHYKALVAARNALTTAARRLLVSIMGVEG